MSANAAPVLRFIFMEASFQRKDPELAAHSGNKTRQKGRRQPKTGHTGLRWLTVRFYVQSAFAVNALAAPERIVDYPPRLG
jgi:hypothetical protein